MPRCADCNKFVGVDEGDPEVEIDADQNDGTFSGTVRITNNCNNCGTELREATFDVEGEFEKWKDGDTIEVEVERIMETEGQGRGTKTFYGFEGEVIRLSKKGTERERVSIGDKIQASHMDEC